MHYLFSMPVIYQLHWHVLMQLHMLNISVGKGRQVITTQYYTTVAIECAGYVL